MKPGLSVVVPTWRRPAALRRLLHSLGAQRPADGRPWEIVVVDNCPRGSAMEWLARFSADPGAPLRVEHEPRQGLSHARNTGLRVAHHPVVAFLDDDTTPAEGWLAAITRAFDDEGVVVAAGPVLPRFERPAPAWLDAQALAALSCLDPGPEVTAVQADQVMGANFALRRERALAAGGFDPHLGRRGLCLLSGEDTELIVRLTDGTAVPLVSGARVWHHIPAERLRRSWHMRRAFWGGRTAARLTGTAPRAETTARPGLTWWQRAAARRRAGVPLFAELRHLAWRGGLAWERLRQRLARS